MPEPCSSKVQELMFMGFDAERARNALIKSGNDVTKAVGLLVDPGLPDPAPIAAPPPQQSAADQDNSAEAPYSIDDAADLETEDLGRAVSLSLQESDVPRSFAAQHEDDENMQRAIQESMKTVPLPQATQDNWNIRTAVPAGLKNVGSTCYVNSVLQVYFHLPFFRRLVFSFPRPLKDAISESSIFVQNANVKFMLELQRLFAYMLLTNRQGINPYECITAILGGNESDGCQHSSSQNNLSIGVQGDVTEFVNSFLTKVEAAIQELQASSPQSPTVMVTMDECSVDHVNGDVGDPELQPASSGASFEEIHTLGTSTSSGHESESSSSVECGKLRHKRSRPEVENSDAATPTSSEDVVMGSSAPHSDSTSSVLDHISKQLCIATNEKPDGDTGGDDGTALSQSEMLKRDMYGVQIEHFDFSECGRTSIQMKPTEEGSGSHEPTQMGDGITMEVNTHKDVVKECEFGPLIVHAGKYTPDLHMALDQIADPEVIDYRTDSGESVKAKRTVRFKRLPNVLTIHIQRVAFDRETGTTVKNNDRMEFPMNFYMDRYMESNWVERQRRRTQELKLLEELNAVRGKIIGIQNYEGKFLTAPNVLDLASDLVKKYSDASEQEQEDLVGALARTKQVIEGTLQGLCKRQTELVNALYALYSDWEKYRYSLHAILVHSGQTDGGHYWAYIRMGNTDRWWCINDTKCEEVAFEAVYAASVGNVHGASSSNCLFYTSDPESRSPHPDVDLDSVTKWSELLPPELIEEVEEDNAKVMRHNCVQRIQSRIVPAVNGMRDILEQTRSIAHRPLDVVWNLHVSPALYIAEWNVKQSRPILDLEYIQALYALEMYTMEFGGEYAQDAVSDDADKAACAFAMGDVLGKTIAHMEAKNRSDDRISEFKQEAFNWRKFYFGISDMLEKALGALVNSENVETVLDALKILWIASRQDFELPAFLQRRMVWERWVLVAVLFIRNGVENYLKSGAIPQAVEIFTYSIYGLVSVATSALYRPALLRALEAWAPTRDKLREALSSVEGGEAMRADFDGASDVMDVASKSSNSSPYFPGLLELPAWYSSASEVRMHPRELITRILYVEGEANKKFWEEATFLFPPADDVNVNSNATTSQGS